MALVTTLTISYYLMPLGDWLRATDEVLPNVKVARWFWILLIGLLVLALTSRNKGLALLSIPAFALGIQGLRAVCRKSVYISFFLGITIGPMMFELLSMLHAELKKTYERRGLKEVKLARIGKIPLNPLKILTREEAAQSTLWSAITSILATVMSP